MSIHPVKQPTDYSDDRAKQSFKDSTDVRKILQRHSRMGTLSHLQQWGGQYGDLAGFDFQTAQNQIAKANSMFEKLPAEIRNEFSNSPQQFFEFVNAEENRDRLAELLPALAKPGYQLPNLRQRPDAPTAPNAGNVTNETNPANSGGGPA